MRVPLSALLCACLLVSPAAAAPAGAIKGFIIAPQFGDVAPLIKVQSMIGQVQNSNGAHQKNGQRSGGQQHPGVQRQGGGGGQPKLGMQRQGGGGQQHNHGGGGNRGGDRHHDRGGNDGAGVAAGVLGGLLLGAIIANESQRNDCSRRPGYDPRSHTFVGADHRRYRCP
jgi:hypothetical protein